jgi:hypothetical protein
MGGFATPETGAMKPEKPQANEHGNAIRSLMPRGPGHQFLVYGDSCSGVPGGRHEATFAAVNAVARRLDPAPGFVAFLGDEVIGLTTDENDLRVQWRHWLDVETAWLDRTSTPMFHTTSNHTTYDEMSERVFTEMLPHLPRNGPRGQEGLSYFVLRDDLLLVFVHTSAMALGGEGHVETEWLARTLAEHGDARYKLVLGHHPVFPVNGFSGPYQREVGAEYAEPFWDILVEFKVSAYLCSHILAFDVQVHRGVPQITTAGAGTAHRMPEGVEYLHLVQMALDEGGLRYQVIDTDGSVRESLEWPGGMAGRLDWMPLSRSSGITSVDVDFGASPHVWRFRGHGIGQSAGSAETLLEAWEPGPAISPLWIGLTGATRKLTVSLAPEAGRSPHSWFGPSLAADEPFDLDVALHPAMGPGGILWRSGDQGAWNTLEGASPWGAERLGVLRYWSIGHGRGGLADRPFRGADLSVSACDDVLPID